MESFVFEQQVLFRVESLCDFQPLFLVPRGGARGQNLGHLKKKYFFIHFSFMGSFVFEKKMLFRVDIGLYGSMPQGGARGQNLGLLYSWHLVIPSVYLKNNSSCGDFKG